ncbi:MAG: transposase, partial [Planctomycetaceae bacterium]
EKVERSFAHMCETGGARRTWLRGLEKINKRYLMVAAGHNLGLILRSLLGSGKPRQMEAVMAVLCELIHCYSSLCVSKHVKEITQRIASLAAPTRTQALVV